MMAIPSLFRIALLSECSLYLINRVTIVSSRKFFDEDELVRLSYLKYIIRIGTK